MYWAGIPLLLAYAVYSLIYEEHKSWYSYIVTTLVGFVYTWGFLMMVFLLCILFLTTGSCVIYQLSSQVGCPYASSDDDLQMYVLVEDSADSSFKYDSGRFVQLLYFHANFASTCLFQR